LRSLPVRRPFYLSTRILFLAKYFFSRAVSHQFFQAVNFIIEVSVLCTEHACLSAKNTRYLNQVCVTTSLKPSYLSRRASLRVNPSHITKAL
jgi:hypothetical protein